MCIWPTRRPRQVLKPMRIHALEKDWRTTRVQYMCPRWASVVIPKHLAPRPCTFAWSRIFFVVPLLLCLWRGSRALLSCISQLLPSSSTINVDVNIRIIYYVEWIGKAGKAGRLWRLGRTPQPEMWQICKIVISNFLESLSWFWKIARIYCSAFAFVLSKHFWHFPVMEKWGEALASFGSFFRPSCTKYRLGTFVKNSCPEILSNKRVNLQSTPFTL